MFRLVHVTEVVQELTKIGRNLRLRCDVQRLPEKALGPAIVVLAIVDDAHDIEYLCLEARGVNSSRKLQCFLQKSKGFIIATLQRIDCSNVPQEMSGLLFVIEFFIKRQRLAI